MAGSPATLLFHAAMDSTTENVYDYLDYDITNVTELPGLDDTMNHQLLSMSYIYLPILYFIIFFAGFSGNLFVLVVIGNRQKRRGRLVDTFMLNLAFADLVFVFTLPLWAVSASKHDHWPFGNLLCKLSSYIIAVNRFSNIFFLTCMSVDRYLAVVRLMESNFLRSTRCVHFTCGTVWVLSLTMAAPSLVYRGLKVHGDNKESCLEDLYSSFFQAMVLLTIVLTFVLPVLVIVLCYGSIVVKLHQHSVTGNPRTKVRHRHSLKIVFTIITAFLVSWLPYNVFRSIQVISRMSNAELSEDAEKYLSKGLIISSCLAFVNSCVNPAIYLFLDKHFRLSATALCLSCLGQGEIQQSFISSNSISTSETAGSTASRRRLFSLAYKN